MMRSAILILALLLATAAHADPANTLQELRIRLGGCLERFHLNPGSVVTIKFAVKRDGSLIGEPKVTYSRLLEGKADQTADAKVVADALYQCLPVAITDGLGGAIAGRMLTFSWGLYRPSGT